MNIYTYIKEANAMNMAKTALSISMDSGANKSYTYSSMFASVEKFSDQLINLGIKPSNRIAIVAENSPEWVIAYLTIMNITCTAVLIDAMLSQNEIKQLLDTSEVLHSNTSVWIVS